MTKEKAQERTFALRFINVSEARAFLSKKIDEAQTVPQVIMNHGKPVAMLIGCDGKSIEDLTAELAKRAAKK